MAIVMAMVQQRAQPTAHAVRSDEVQKNDKKLWTVTWQTANNSR